MIGNLASFKNAAQKNLKKKIKPKCVLLKHCWDNV